MSRVLQPVDVNVQNGKAPAATNPEICSPGPKKVIVGIRSSTNGEKIVAEYILSAFLGKVRSSFNILLISLRVVHSLRTYNRKLINSEIVI